MHVNFLTKKRVRLDADYLKTLVSDFKLTNLTMMAIAGTAIFFMVFTGVVQKIRVDRLSGKKSRLEARIEAVENELAKSGGIAAAAAGKAGLIKNFEARYDWPDSLQEIVSHITSGLWVQSIRVGGAEAGAVEISGVAPSQNAVADLMESLREIASEGDVGLVSSSSAKEVIGKIKFSIRLKMKR